MGQKKKSRGDRPAKRVFQGNQHTEGRKKSRMDEKNATLDETNTVDRASEESTSCSGVDLLDVTTASAAKLDLSVIDDSDVAEQSSLTGFRFVDVELLVEFVQRLLCPNCKEPLGGTGAGVKQSGAVAEAKTSQFSKLTFTCKCKQACSLRTSRKQGKVFEINRRLPMAMFSIGKNRRAAERFLGNMNMPPPPANKSWNNHKKAVCTATKTIAAASAKQGVAEVTSSQGRDIMVSVDGTWQRRGFASKNGVVTVLSVNDKISKVIDTVALSNYCYACAKSKKNLDSVKFKEWHINHLASGKCLRNHEGFAGSMESAGAEISFRRSEDLHDLRYVDYLGDGDSKSYTRIKNADSPIYNGVQVSKLECCGHVQKRMGRQLMNKVAEMKSMSFVHDGRRVKGIGGGKGLKKSRILNIQGHYGAAIRQNAGNLEGMKRAVWAIYEHRNKQHDNCGSWCPSKKQNGGDPNKNALPPYVMEAIRPVFETLSDDRLLEKCVHGGTQNTNESFHHLIWERCPKTTFCGLNRVELAVADATIVFNDGEAKRLDIFPQLGMKAGVYAEKCFKMLDKGRQSNAATRETVRSKEERRQRAMSDAIDLQTAHSDSDYLAGGH